MTIKSPLPFRSDFATDVFCQRKSAANVKTTKTDLQSFFKFQI